MRINGFRCDACGKEHLIDRTTAIDAYDVYRLTPDGWYVVSLGAPNTTEEPWLFCSKKCLCAHPLRNANTKAGEG